MNTGSPLCENFQTMISTFVAEQKTTRETVQKTIPSKIHRFEQNPIYELFCNVTAVPWKSITKQPPCSPPEMDEEKPRTALAPFSLASFRIIAVPLARKHSASCVNDESVLEWTLTNLAIASFAIRWPPDPQPLGSHGPIDPADQPVMVTHVTELCD